MERLDADIVLLLLRLARYITSHLVYLGRTYIVHQVIRYSESMKGVNDEKKYLKLKTIQ